MEMCNIGYIGALIIRIGLGGILYYSHNKEPHNSIGNYLGPYSNGSLMPAGLPPMCSPANPG